MTPEQPSTSQADTLRNERGTEAIPVRSLRGLLLEGLVIVASILLAFAIDAGWDEFRESERERRLLMQLTDELDLFLDNLGPAAFRVTDRVESDVQLLLEFIHGSEDAVNPEVTGALAYLHRSYEFSAATPVLDVLTGDGGLQLISDAGIRQELATVSSLLGVVERFEELQGNFIATELNPWLNENVDRYPLRFGQNREDESSRPSSRFETGIETIRSREFSNLLIERDRYLGVVSLFRNQALKHMGTLRDQIQNQIGNPARPDESEDA